MTANIKNLEIWAEFLESDKCKDDAFDINTYYDEREGETACGFVACAVGWACFVPKFKKLSLHLSKRNLQPTIKIGPHKTETSYGPAIVEKLFGLDYLDALVIIHAESYIGAKKPYYPTRYEVAARIREIIAKHKKKEKNNADHPDLSSTPDSTPA